MNVAVALAKHSGLRVGLLDADVYGPSIPRLMALKGKPPVNEGAPNALQQTPLTGAMHGPCMPA